MWRNPIPWKNTPETPNIGTWAQTDDMRVGMGLRGPDESARRSSRTAASSSARTAAPSSRSQQRFTYGVSANRPGTATRVVGSLLRTKLVDDASPIVYGVPDNLAVYSDNGDSFSVSATVGGGGRGGGGGGGGGRRRPRRRRASRPTGRGTPDDPDVVQGRPAYEGTNLPPEPPPPDVQPWQYALPTDEQLKRNPANLIPPAVPAARGAALRRAEHAARVGLLDGGGDIAQRPVVVDVPVGKGHVVLFANNPI